MSKSKKYYSPKRRAVYYRGDDIDALVLFDLFAWTCFICNEPIDRRCRVPNWNAATIEHIMPISRGGEHVWSNIAPAHLKCNLDKDCGLPGDIIQGIQVDSIKLV